MIVDLLVVPDMPQRRKLVVIAVCLGAQVKVGE
jgi:hypothetical protein